MLLSIFAPGALSSNHPPLPCCSTPPPAFEDALRGDLVESTLVRHRTGANHQHVVRNYRSSESTR